MDAMLEDGARHGGATPARSDAGHAGATRRAPADAPVPPPAPLAMPTQDLCAPPPPRRFARQPPGTLPARLITFGGSALLSAWGTLQMYRVVLASDVTPLECAFVVFFGVTFGWIALAACAALAGVLEGALAWLRRVVGPLLGRAPAARATHADPADIGSRAGCVAIVMPIYNEDPAETCAALQTMAEELAVSGRARDFEIFVLSDTTRADVWLAETAAFDALREALGGVMPVWYRRRRENSARKAGNLRDFVECWGERYEGMIVLDADSLIAADTLIALAEGLHADPHLGILQSVPALAGGTSLFARLQQFAGSVYGPVVSHGMAAWQGSDGNYWGHNAIIRTVAFAAACGLPTLPGRRPLGGDILSHDFVEAALIRKAGWSVRMLPGLSGSWENSPPSLLDVAVRDRRWAQGNVQHLAVLGARGLAWPNRMHFVIGVASYAMSALWLCLIVIGLALSLQAVLVQPSYFPDYATLFPLWPVFDSELMRELFVFSMLTLLVPKAVGAVRVLARGTRRAAHGGTPRFLLSLVLEIVLSALYAPVMMLLQTKQLWEIVRGRDSGWNLQQRASVGVPWTTAWARHWPHVAIGVLLTAALALLSPTLLPWMSPIILGLVLAAPLSRWSADVRIGRALARAGLLLVPEESAPPPQFATRARLRETYARVIAGSDLQALVHDPESRRRHFDVASSAGPAPAYSPRGGATSGAAASAPGASRPRGRPDPVRLSTEAKVEDAHSAEELFEWLEPRELMTLLGDRELFERIVAKTVRIA